MSCWVLIQVVLYGNIDSHRHICYIVEDAMHRMEWLPRLSKLQFWTGMQRAPTGSNSGSISGWNK
jgi:hypothetical protein